MIRLPQHILEAYLTDPVLAAEVLMGWELDTFQQIRLRYYWWVPDVIDSSGVATGKTLVDFIYLNLRVMLLPDHIGAIFFPAFQTGKDSFWPYFGKTIDQSNFYADQLVFHHGKLGEHRNPGAWIMDWKDGSQIVMPAPGHQQDAKQHASRNFNTLVMEEYLVTDEMGSSMDRQLIDRVRRESYNQHHPVWSNHTKLLGHAGEPSHKGYFRYKKTKRAIRDGSQSDALISFCYLDYSPEYAKRLVPERLIRNRRIHLSRDQFRRQWLGLWSADGDTYYPDVVLRRALRVEVVPLLRRERPGDYYMAGLDVAESQSGNKSDFSALTVIRVRPVSDRAEATMECEGQYFHVAYVYSHVLRKRTAAQLSGWLYWAHRAFSLCRVVIDRGGGGTWVYERMQETTQLVNGEPVEVIPLCTREDPLQMQKQPLVTFFKRGTEIDRLVNPAFLSGDEGLIDGLHRQYREAWEAGHFVLPMDRQDRSPQELREWTPEQQAAGAGLERMRNELVNVRVKIDKEGNKKTSAKGFQLFESKMKKDAAYSGWYAWVAMKLWMHDHAGADSEGEGDLVAAA